MVASLVGAALLVALALAAAARAEAPAPENPVTPSAPPAPAAPGGAIGVAFLEGAATVRDPGAPPRALAVGDALHEGNLVATRKRARGWS